MNAPFDAHKVAAEAMARAGTGTAPEPAPVDLAVLNLHRRPPPVLPLDVFGPRWACWISGAAEAASAPRDYVAGAVLTAASALIGNARDFPDRLREHRAAVETAKARAEVWEKDVRAAQKGNAAPPLPPADLEPAPEPMVPRLKQSDVTVEKVATLLARAAPKGLLLARDELEGWLKGMTQYNEGACAFWIESYGGRPYRVERQKELQPIDVLYLAVAWFGGIQPEKLAETMREADDGLLARFCWIWPEPVPFELSRTPPEVEWATEALDWLRLLEMTAHPARHGSYAGDGAA